MTPSRDIYVRGYTFPSLTFQGLYVPGKDICGGLGFIFPGLAHRGLSCPVVASHERRLQSCPALTLQDMADRAEARYGTGMHSISDLGPQFCPGLKRHFLFLSVTGRVGAIVKQGSTSPVWFLRACGMLQRPAMNARVRISQTGFPRACWS